MLLGIVLVRHDNPVDKPHLPFRSRIWPLRSFVHHFQVIRASISVWARFFLYLPLTIGTLSTRPTIVTTFHSKRHVNHPVIRQNLGCSEHQHVCRSLCYCICSLEAVSAGSLTCRSDSGQLSRPPMVVTGSGRRGEGSNKPGQPPAEVYRF